MNEIISRILNEHNELLSLPQTLAEVLRIVKDEHSSAQDLADVLLKDPALTAKILRIVNSPFYGVRREISSMQHAVVTLGTRQVTAVALSASIYNLASRWDSSVDRVRFWRHSLEVAIASRLIAERCGYQHTEEAFISGLLHDIGTLILEKSFPKDFARIRKEVERGESLIDLEEETWGTNHARVGQFLLEQWNIPSVISTAVGHHHDLFVAGTDNPEMVLSQVVCLGNLMSQFTVSETRRMTLLFEAENREIISENLKLSSEKMSEVQQMLFSKMLEESAYLEIEIGSFDELLGEANRLLLQQYLTVEGLLRENRKLQQQITRDQMKRVAMDSLRNVALTLNQHINNATATILGRAQLVEMAIKKGEIPDNQDKLATSMRVISNGVETIGSVMKDLTNMAYLEASEYPDQSGGVDIEKRIRQQLERIEIGEPVA